MGNYSGKNIDHSHNETFTLPTRKQLQLSSKDKHPVDDYPTFEHNMLFRMSTLNKTNNHDNINFEEFEGKTTQSQCKQLKFFVEVLKANPSVKKSNLDVSYVHNNHHWYTQQCPYAGNICCYVKVSWEHEDKRSFLKKYWNDLLDTII